MFLLVSPPFSDSAQHAIIVSIPPIIPCVMFTEFDESIQFLVLKIKIKGICSFITKYHLQENMVVAKESGRGKPRS